MLKLTSHVLNLTLHKTFFSTRYWKIANEKQRQLKLLQPLLTLTFIVDVVRSTNFPEVIPEDFL